MIESGRYDQIPRENRLSLADLMKLKTIYTSFSTAALNILFQETNFTIKCSSMFKISNSYLQ